MSDVFSRWDRSIDCLVQELLEEVAYEGNPVDAIGLARQLGVKVILDDSQQNRGRHKMMRGKPLIVVRPDPREERLQWAVAHELGEVFGYRVYESLNEVPSDDQEVPSREDVANRFAKSLLLPRKPFEESVQEHDGNLFELKAIYSTASYELIATRLLDFEPPRMVSIFDHGRLTRRWNNFSSRTNPLHAIEKQCWRESHQKCELIERNSEEMRIRCWPIHEPEWKREILQTVPIEHWD